MSISEDQVYEAAEELSKSGKNPSALSIREILKTGSLGTIQKYLVKWRHKETVSASTQNPPPEELLELTRSYLEKIWGTAIHISRKEANVKIKEADLERKQSLKDSDSAWSEVERMEKSLGKEKSLQEELNRQIDDLKHSSEKEELARRELEQENAIFKEKISVLKENQTTLSEQHQSIERLLQDAKREAEQKSKLLETLRSELAVAQAELSQFQSVNQEIKLNIKICEESLAETEVNYKLSQQKINDLQEQLAQEKNNTADEKIKCDNLLKSNSKYEVIIEQRDQEIEELRSYINQLEAQKVEDPEKNA